MDVDASLKIVGPFGRMQIANLVLFGLANSWGSFQITSVAFTINQSLEHHCKPWPRFSANETTPLISKDGQQVPDGCHMYEVYNGTLTENITTCQNGWEFPAVSVGESTVLTDVRKLTLRIPLFGLKIVKREERNTVKKKTNL